MARLDPRGFPPGAILTPHRGEVVYDLFAYAVSAKLPPGTRAVGVQGGDVAAQRNQAVRNALEDPACTWVLFLDSDQYLLEPDLVLRLLAHDAPVVSAVIPSRIYPFRVCAFASVDPPVHVEGTGLPASGLVTVAACGCGCLLVRREVFDAVLDPWFRVGEYDVDRAAEDVSFTARAAAKGFAPALDAGLRLGHDFRGVVRVGADGRPWLRLPGDEELWTPLFGRVTVQATAGPDA